MIQKVFCVIIVLSGMSNIGDAVTTNFLYEKDSRFDDKRDEANILRISNNTSSIRCATNCDADPNCVAFYVNPTTRTCQEQSALSSTDLVGVTSSPGYRYYRSCVPQVTPPPAVLFECPVSNADWTTGHLPDGTYLFKVFANLMVDYTTAFNICKDIGANLPKIYDVDKMNFYLTNIFTCSSISNLWLWIDGTNINAPNKTSPDAWTTHDGIVIPQIPELWYTGRPNYPVTDNCIHSKFASFRFKFDDAVCGYPLYQVLCEKKISC